MSGGNGNRNRNTYHFKRYEEKTDDEITSNVLEIIKAQNELKELANKELDKIIELRKKHEELRKPIYEKINEIIKSITNFWVHLFSSHFGLCRRLHEVDLQILEYMTFIEVENTIDSGYSISFNFRPNPLFKEIKVTKRFHCLDHLNPKVTTSRVHHKEKGKEMQIGVDCGTVESKKRRTNINESFFYEWFREAHQGVEDDDEPVCEVASGSELMAGTLIKHVWDDICSYTKEALIEACDVAGDDDDKEMDCKRKRSLRHPIQHKVRRLEELEGLKGDLKKVRDEIESAISEVHKEYLRLCKLGYDMRNERIKSCPDFWMKAFFGYRLLDKHVHPNDREILKYMTSIEVEDQDTIDLKSGFSISFNFSSNPYFEDTKLTKTFQLVDKTTIVEVTAANINWKEGMKIPIGLDSGKKRNKRPRIKESFFNWFIETHNDKDYLLSLVTGHIRELWYDPVKYFIKYVKSGASKLGDGDKVYDDFDDELDDELIKHFCAGDDDDDDEDDDDDKEE